MTPFYGRLPNVVGFDVGKWIDPVGLGLTGLVAAAAALHGVGEIVRRRIGSHPAGEDGSEAK
jgi:hypothetical protein